MSYEEAVVHVRSKRICINTTHFENELMALEADLEVSKQLKEKNIEPLTQELIKFEELGEAVRSKISNAI